MLQTVTIQTKDGRKMAVDDLNDWALSSVPRGAYLEVTGADVGARERTAAGVNGSVQVKGDLYINDRLFTWYSAPFQVDLYEEEVTTSNNYSKPE